MFGVRGCDVGLGCQCSHFRALGIEGLGFRAVRVPYWVVVSGPWKSLYEEVPL